MKITLKLIQQKLLVLISLISLAFSQYVLASDSDFLLKSQLEAFEKVSKITVVFYGRNPWTGELIRSEDQRYGDNNFIKVRGLACNYVSENKDSILKLKKLLLQYGVQESSNHYLPYVGIAIYVEYLDGQEGHIYLGRQYIDESKVDAEVMLKPDVRLQMAVLDKDVYRALLKWMRDYGKVQIGKGLYSPSDVQGHYKTCAKSADPNFYRENSQQKCDSQNDNWRLPNECPTGWKPEMRN